MWHGFLTWHACRSESNARGVEKLWTVRFMQKVGPTWHIYAFSKSHSSPHTDFRPMHMF